MQYLGAISKMTEWLVRFQGKPFNITVIQVYAPTTDAEEAEVESFYEDLQDLSELTPQKGILFIMGDWNAKVGSQEIPGVTGQVWPWSTKWGRKKTNRVLPRECTGHSKHPFPTTRETTLHMDITIPKSDWLYSCSQRWRNSTQSAKTRPGAACGSDHELLIAKCRLKLKKVGKPLSHSGMT